MGLIRALPTQVVNQIAAGEVVERPASVLKELLENALDARATRVDVEVSEGGLSLVRVSDDGVGISPEDLSAALEPHATSKLRQAQDLFAVATFGFRGEALASIASVARVRLLSRQANSEAGHEVRCAGGEMAALAPCGAPVGTTVEVADLFFNTPARRKWLKTASTELGRLTETLTRLAVAHPGVHFTFTHNGRRLYDIPRSGSVVERVGFFFGHALARRMLAVEGEADSMRLSGAIAPPQDSKPNQGMMFFFVNSRYVRDKTLAHAVSQAYAEYLMAQRWPVVFLNLEIDPALVDVNVHPTKIEVRFRHTHDVHEFMLGAVRARLRAARLTKEVEVPGAGGVEALRFNVTEGERFIDARDLVDEGRGHQGGMVLPSGAGGGPAGAGLDLAGDAAARDRRDGARRAMEDFFADPRERAADFGARDAWPGPGAASTGATPPAASFQRLAHWPERPVSEGREASSGVGGPAAEAISVDGARVSPIRLLDGTAGGAEGGGPGAASTAKAAAVPA
ncbi:MAG: DNA mismatch repair endonuclease MutL, partial [Planctomycetes bacterium]|nr:DNA mismatch repair endonuclease MutL [Planctomycetota bacterium]